MTLDEATAGSNVSDVRGRLVFDFGGSVCTGYALKSRLVTEVVDREGNSNVTDLQSSTWENASGDNFRFENSQYSHQFAGSGHVARKLTEQVSGTAARREKNDMIEVKINQPATLKLNFGGRVLFPTQHSIAILEAAARGEAMLQADIFDGSEQGNKLLNTTTFIGKPIEPGTDGIADKVQNAERLDQFISWPVLISYYDAITNPARDDGLPTYELSFHLFANGVSSDLLVNYGNLLIRGKLARIDFYEAADCPEVPSKKPKAGP